MPVMQSKDFQVIHKIFHRNIDFVHPAQIMLYTTGANMGPRMDCLTNSTGVCSVLQMQRQSLMLQRTSLLLSTLAMRVAAKKICCIC